MARIRVQKMRKQELLFLGIKRDEGCQNVEDQDDIFKFLQKRHIDENEPKDINLKLKVNYNVF